MAIPIYKNAEEAEKTLTREFNPQNQAQVEAIRRASSLVPTITAQNANPNVQAIKIPSPKPDTTNYGATIASGQGQIGAYTPTAVPTTTGKTLEQQLRDRLTGADTPPPSLASSYETAQNSAGITAKEQDVLHKNQILKSAQSALAGVQAEIKAVMDTATANKLKLEGESQGRGIVASVLNRQQSEIDRLAAIQVLPLQARALAAQAQIQSAQGDVQLSQETLSTAQNKLDKTFQLQSQDVQNTYNYNKELRKSILDILDSSEKATLSKLEKAQDFNYRSVTDAINNAQALSKSAMDNGQSDIATQIGQLQAPKYNSPTFDEEMRNYNNEVARLQGQIKVKPPKATEAEIDRGAVQNITNQLLNNRGSDGYTNTDLYAKLRTTASISASDFNSRFGYLLNPNAREKLGVKMGGGGLDFENL